jgi:hypothetical protein
LERAETYRPSVTHAVGRHDAEAHLQEHGDLIAPSHRDVGEAMDLGGPGALELSGIMLPRQIGVGENRNPLKTYQEQCSPGRALGLAVEVSCPGVSSERKEGGGGREARKSRFG